MVPNPRKLTDQVVARRIGLHHIAFYRGHFEGLDTRLLGERYLDTGPDLVKAKRTLRWVRDELIAAARKYKPSLVKVLSIPFVKLTAAEQGAVATAMTLEDFQASRDPEGFYTEAELIALFEKEVVIGDPVALRKARRNDRLRRKVRDAVSWLEGWIASPPRPQDHVLAWLETQSGQRLMAVGLETLEGLVAHIEKRGKHWHRKIPKLGPVQAGRIDHWLRANRLLAETPLVVPGRHTVNTHNRAGATVIVPLDRLHVPNDLSGATGLNRAYSNKLSAPDDLAAIHAWLASLGPRDNTVRSYRKEAERFLLWMIFERGKPLSSATTEDCISYRDFINALDGSQLWYWRLPRASWIGARSTARWSEDWRPFSGKLSASSQKLAVTILTAMAEWLVRQRYLDSNPWDGVPPAQNFTPRIRTDHSLTVDQWQTVIAACEELPKDEAYYRIRFVLLFAYGSGLRLSELAAATIAEPHEKPGQVALGLKEFDRDWEITVMGKGGKVRTLPIPIEVMAALQDYLVARGFTEDVRAWPAGTPLIATLGHGFQYVHAERQPVSPSSLYRLLRKHFKHAAKEMKNARDAGHLLAASTHWLRHTHATHALEAGAAIDEVQENLGHASPATTAIYSHAGRKRRRAAINKLMAFGSAPQTSEADAQFAKP